MAPLRLSSRYTRSMMTQKYVELDRRFRTVTAAEADSPTRLFASGQGGELGWADLLDQPRVVILAEAGSGKSHELKACARALAEDGDLACYATVQDLARSGFQAALGPADRQTFMAWEADPEAHCWLFIDSVDEAKDEGLSFETAMRQLANAVVGREERVNIIISGRFTDWDFTEDPQAMTEWLAIPTPPEPLPDYRDLIVETLHNKTPPRAKPAPKADVSIVLMTPLDKDQIRRFADASGTPDAGAFVVAIERGDLWGFAGRPLDLEWMTLYWRDNGRLGTLAEMLEASLEARSVEVKTVKRRRDPLSKDQVRLGLRRIGAGLLVTGAETVRVPNSSPAHASVQHAMVLDPLLPGWPPKDIGVLLSRPVFDPATLGRVRLHNDNSGAVRSYLTALWLDDRLTDNCPPQAVQDLLFATPYGRAVVRPNMAEVGAWLALRRPEIAEEYLRRDPVALLTKGDPAALSPAVRVRLVERALEAVRDPDHTLPWFTQGYLRRVSDKTLEPLVEGWWRRYRDETDPRHLILQIIEMARLTTGLEIVRAAAFDTALDDRSQILGGEALLVLGTRQDAEAYARHIRTGARTLPRPVVISALAALFPTHLGVTDFFDLIDAAGVADEEGHRSVYPLGGELHADLTDPAALLAFVEGVLARIGPLGEAKEEPVFLEAFGQTAVSAALRLLKNRPETLPDVAIDLILRLSEGQWSRRREAEEQELAAALVSSEPRRRQSFWRAVEVLKDHPYQNGGLPSVNQLIHHGWPGNLVSDDLDWLLADAAGQDTAEKRKLAFRTALGVPRDADTFPTAEDRIEATASADADLQRLLTAWRTPEPESPSLTASLAQMKTQRQTQELETQKRDDSWVQFVEGLRADPEALDRLIPQTKTTADRRLVDLYQLLSSRMRSRSRYSVESLAAVEPILGPVVTAKFGGALIAFARQWTPVAPSERGPEAPDGFTSFDIMGLAGISLEAATTPGWAEALDPDAARLAAVYALVELNGFPDYLGRLAAAQPEVVQAILDAEVRAHILASRPDAHGILDRLAYADVALARLVTPSLAGLLEDEANFPPLMLPKVIDVVSRGSPEQVPTLALMAARRAITVTDPEVAALFLALLFAADPEQGIAVLHQKAAGLNDADRTALCTALLPRLFGDRLGVNPTNPALSFGGLLKLIRIAFDTVRLSDDIDRVGGGVYSPGARDHAQDARNAIMSRLEDTPGEATYEALKAFAAMPDFPVPSRWLLRAARRRAEQDAMLTPWKVHDLIDFEQTFEKSPTTTIELQSLVRRRLEKIAHDLVHGKFAQADTLKGLVNENAVQRWIADRFETLRGRAYSVERETHVADDKEPDITLTSRDSGVALPIEIKVIDGMSLPELERALEAQLCGQYLRHSAARHGVLLLIHQKPRAAGWKLPDAEGHVPLERIMAHLEERAQAIRTQDPLGPQPIVLLIDVSK